MWLTCKRAHAGTVDWGLKTSITFVWLSIYQYTDFHFPFEAQRTPPPLPPKHTHTHTHTHTTPSLSHVMLAGSITNPPLFMMGWDYWRLVKAVFLFSLYLFLSFLLSFCLSFFLSIFLYCPARFTAFVWSHCNPVYTHRPDINEYFSQCLWRCYSWLSNVHTLFECLHMLHQTLSSPPSSISVSTQDWA